MKTQKVLFEAIIKFMKVTYLCLEQTNFAEDRSAYQRDIVLCAKWIITLADCPEIETVIREIIDPSTDKSLFDYYKRGEFADNQIAAFNELKSTIEFIRNAG